MYVIVLFTQRTSDTVVVDELLGILTATGVICLGYADDIVIMAKGKFEGTLCDLVEARDHQKMVFISGIDNQLIQKPQWYLSPGEEDFST